MNYYNRMRVNRIFINDTLEYKRHEKCRNWCGFHNQYSIYWQNDVMTNVTINHKQIKWKKTRNTKYANYERMLCWGKVLWLCGNRTNVYWNQKSNSTSATVTAHLQMCKIPWMQIREDYFVMLFMFLFRQCVITASNHICNRHIWHCFQL